MHIRFSLGVTLLVAILFLSGCQSGGGVSSVIRPSKDGAPEKLLSPEEAARIPDAVPKVEIRTKAGNKSPYTVLGKTYRVLPDSVGYKERGYASWYGTKFHGQKTSNGEEYDLYAMTAAHKTLPIPSYVRVTNLQNGKKIVVRVNDRGPFHDGRIIDLSYAAAAKLGFGGTAMVEVEAIDPRNDQVPPPIVPDTVPYPAAKTNTQHQEDLLAEAQQEAVEASTEIAATHERAVTSSTASAGDIYLQLAAFTSVASAQSLKNKAQRILNIPVVVSTNPDNQMHRVRVGPIHMEQVESIESKIRSAQLGESIVVME